MRSAVSQFSIVALLAFLILHFAGYSAERIPWTTSRIQGSPEKPAKFRLERALNSLSFTNPLDIAFSPELDRWFVAEQGGKIFTFDPAGRQLHLAADFAKLQGPEGCFYALTFDPAFASNRFIYTCYALKSDLPEGSRVSRFKVKSGPEPKIDFATEEIIITWLSGGHNGCCLKFGPDGCLYISTGDGAGPNPPDPLKAGQDVSNLLSAILRIDVRGKANGKNYLVPPDNPLIHLPNARPEIWAYGFRNPWRMGFDRKTGDLWVGDVGWELWELLYRVERGGNYGWSILEGRQPVLPEDPRGPTPILPPTKEHPHHEAASITGGVVYYGKRFPELTGSFIYGDWETGKIWAIRAEGEKVTWSEELADSTTRIVSFAEDREGEIYVLDYNGGIYSLEQNQAAQSQSDFPTKLSETGLFTSTARHEVAPGVVAFSVNAEMWNDHGAAARFVALPFESTIDATEKPWRYPSNAVLARTISLEMERGSASSARRIETQILHHTGDGWGAYSYRWNDEQTDATLVPAEGANEILRVKDPHEPGGERVQAWRFHSRTECLRCHNPWCGIALAFQPEQLSRELNGAGQLEQLRELRIINSVRKQSQRALVSPDDPRAPLDARARSYLHVNCSHCHRENAGGSVPSVMNFELPIEKTRMLGARPILGDLGLHNGKVIAPGDPFSSVLFFRAAATGRTRMPYIGSELVDERGLDLLREWIDSLAAPRANSSAQMHALKTELARAPAEEIALRHSSNSKSALRLAYALSGPELPVATKERIATAVMRASSPLIHELVARFLPAQARPARAAATASPREILALSGNAARGTSLLTDTSRLNCLQCHRFNNLGRNFGPDLKASSRDRSSEQLLQSILEPSREIAPEFVLHTLDLDDGEQLAGIIVKQTEQEIVLRDASATDYKIAVNSIVSRRPQQLSAMPEGLLDGLTAQDVADLLAAIRE